MMPATVPNRPTNGADEAMVARPRNAALQLRVYDGFGAFESAARGLDLFAGNIGRNLVRLEFLKPGHDDFRQVALLVAVGDLYGLIQLAFAQRAGYGRSERARLLLGRVICHEAVDHDADGIRRHQEQQHDDAAGQAAHLRPKVYRVPAYGAIRPAA